MLRMGSIASLLERLARDDHWETSTTVERSCIPSREVECCPNHHLLRAVYINASQESVLDDDLSLFALYLEATQRQRDREFMNQFDDIAHIFQLSVAPLFLLTGVATLLNVLSGRLARIIDRARVLEKELDVPEPRHEAAIVTELCALEKRGKLIYHAVKLSTTSALLVCLVIAAVFASSMLHSLVHILVRACLSRPCLRQSQVWFSSSGRFTSQSRLRDRIAHPKTTAAT